MEKDASVQPVPRRARFHLSEEAQQRALAVGLVVLGLLCWELFVRTGMFGLHSQISNAPLRAFIAPPSAIVGSVFAWATQPNSTLWTDLLITLRRLLIGYVLGGVPALLLGLGMGRYYWLRASFPLLAVAGLVPAVALLSISIIVFGQGEGAKWSIIALAVFFPVLYCTRVSVLATPAAHQDPAELRRRLAWVFAGLKLGMVIALATALVTELYGATAGLGYDLAVYGATFSAQRVSMATAVVSLIAYILWLLLVGIEHLLTVRLVRRDAGEEVPTPT